MSEAEEVLWDREQMRHLLAVSESGPKPTELDIRFAFTCLREPDLETSKTAALLVSIYYRRGFVSLSTMLDYLKYFWGDSERQRNYTFPFMEEMAKKESGDPAKMLEYGKMLRITEAPEDQISDEELKIARDLLSRKGPEGALVVGLMLFFKSDLQWEDVKEGKELISEGSRKHDTELGKKFWGRVSFQFMVYNRTFQE